MQTMVSKRVWLLLLVCISAFSGCTRQLIIQQPEGYRPDKKAILVLPGLRNSGKGHRAAKEWYTSQGYDTFIPEYVSRDGFDGSVENLHSFIRKYHIDEYQEVYAFVFLMGGWTLNKYLEKHAFSNLTKIVYDRSPYQEQAPRIVLDTVGWAVRLRFGEAVDQLRDMPYPTIEKGNRTIGIIVETRATPFIRRHKEDLVPIPASAWTPDGFMQPHDDIMYVHLHHDEMYYSYDKIGENLISFFETGRFTVSAHRTRSNQDPFQ